MLLTVVKGTAQGVSMFAQTCEKLEGTLVKIGNSRQGKSTNPQRPVATVLSF